MKREKAEEEKSFILNKVAKHGKLLIEFVVQLSKTSIEKTTNSKIFLLKSVPRPDTPKLI
jgi:hypothetical protein